MDLEVRRRLEDEADELQRALRKEEEERDLDQQEWSRQRREEEDKWQRVFDRKEQVRPAAFSDKAGADSATQDLAHAQAEATQHKNLVAIRESDLQKLQDALNGLESESRRLGETHTNDRFSLELELDRIKRDLARCEDDLDRARKEGEKRGELLRERDMSLATLVRRRVMEGTGADCVWRRTRRRRTSLRSLRRRLKLGSASRRSLTRRSRCVPARLYFPGQR